MATKEEKERINECFANRGLLFESRLDKYTKQEVAKHFECCKNCQEWAEKKNVSWRIMVKQ